jgi:tetratricopeptide (TPR) repeat protein
MKDDTLLLFDELLEHDSSSKIFFPLARLYRKQGHLDRAVQIVQKGLEHHPDYLDAQLFLVELLHEQGNFTGAQSKAMALFSKLQEYDKFWFSLRSHFASLQRTNLGLAAFIIERSASGHEIDLSKLLTAGMGHYAEECSVIPGTSEPEADLDAEEVAQIFINSGIKTKTMAKLLTAQGEYAQAVKIYDELLVNTQDEAERVELESLRETAQKELRGVEEPADDKNAKLYRVLNSLASRLEDKNANSELITKA